MGEQLRCFTVKNADGVWLCAVGVVFAESEQQARQLFDKALTDAGLRQKYGPYDLQEIPLTGAHIIWDGDY